MIRPKVSSAEFCMPPYLFNLKTFSIKISAMIFKKSNLWAVVFVLSTFCQHLDAAERVVQFSGIVSSITERKETTEFLDKVLCNLVIVNTSQTASSQQIQDITFYNYGYSGANLRSAKVQASSGGADPEFSRFNQMLITSGGSAPGTACVGVGGGSPAMGPLDTCVVQFMTNTIPAGSSTIGVCSGNIRVSDASPGSPGFVIASGSASLIQEVKVLGGVLSGAHFLSGPNFGADIAATGGFSSSAIAGNAGAVEMLAAGTPATAPAAFNKLPTNMNIGCRNSCLAQPVGVVQSLARHGNPSDQGPSINGFLYSGTVFNAVRDFCRSDFGNTPPSSGWSIYENLWGDKSTANSWANLPGGATITTARAAGVNTFVPAFGPGIYGTAVAKSINQECLRGSGKPGQNFMHALRGCHYEIFKKECYQIVDELEKDFYDGNLGYSEGDLYNAFSYAFYNVYLRFNSEQVFLKSCYLPKILANKVGASGGGSFSPIDTVATVVGTQNSSSFPGDPTEAPTANCLASGAGSLSSDSPDKAIGFLTDYISEVIVPNGFQSTQSPFVYSQTRSAGTSYIPSAGGVANTTVLCDAVCGGAAAGTTGLHEPNLGLPAGTYDEGRGLAGDTSDGARLTYGSIGQKIAPPEFNGGLVKELMIGGFGTICSANVGFNDWNNIKDSSATGPFGSSASFNSQSINGQFRYCANRNNGGADDLLFGVQGLISFPVNGGSPF